MNNPNKLTVLRIIMVPLFMFFMLTDFVPYTGLFALLIFALASLTDMIDGKLARKYNQITDFGKFLDPLADKMLVTAALVCFVQMGLTDAWVCMIIIAREFLVTSLRLVAAGGGKVIAASIWGKVKTVSQLISIITVILLHELQAMAVIPATVPVPVISDILLWICAILTLFSGATYMLSLIHI